MTTADFKSSKLTDAQRKAMHELQERSGIDWDAFLAMSMYPTSLTPYVAVTDFHGMFIGIEADGFTHS